MNHARAKRARGFTLVEMLIALVMFSVIGLAATNFMMKQSQFMGRTSEVASAQQGVRAAADRIATDVRVVGQGLNFYQIQLPDMIVPNDGTVGVNVHQSNAISLIGIPDPTDPSNQLAMASGVVGNGDVGDTQITVDSTANLTGLAIGERLILYDPNSGNSQVVALTGIVGFDLQFTGDTLIYQFPAGGTTPARAIKLNEVRYRQRTVGGTPFLERKVNRDAWQRFIDGIVTLDFKYYDPTGTEMTSITTKTQRRNIHEVRVEVEGIQLRLGSGGENRAHVKYRSSAVPRNMIP
ncbi:MAG: type II secretion system GspH family protein [Gemmatimonadetes bacterium]|nr:type II secretion system GspH family protein [Gemmatimonadota bacterium]